MHTDYRVGDRVVCTHPYGNVQVGETGTLVDIETLYPEYGVRWDNANERRHNCQGHCEMRHGWYVGEKNIKREPAPDFGDIFTDESSNNICDLFGGVL